MRIHFPDLGASYSWPWKQKSKWKYPKVNHHKTNMHWQIHTALNSQGQWSYEVSHTIKHMLLHHQHFGSCPYEAITKHSTLIITYELLFYKCLQLRKITNKTWVTISKKITLPINTWLLTYLQVKHLVENFHLARRLS